jgi:NDP-sugar pyrophosphorylase family protein
MAGLSSRFFNAGFDKPKYMLEVDGVSVFSKAVLSFKHYFNKEPFIFITRNIYNTNQFVTNELQKLGLEDYRIITLNHETNGQAETVFLATQELESDEPIIIFNIDTFRKNYRKPKFIGECDGYLEVFDGPGNHWSFIFPKDSETVARTAEKERISDLCSDGLYYFKSKNTFEEAYLNAVSTNSSINGEYYVAPLYNRLIESGKIVKFMKVHPNEIEFCGTPSEYINLLKIYEEAKHEK